MTPDDTLAFLRCVLPSEGIYCAVTFDSPTPKPGIDFPRQHQCATVEQLADLLLFHDRMGRTVFHACATYGSKQGVWNEQKQKYQFRSQANVHKVRSLWLDVDAGPGKPYADAYAAAVAVSDFCVRIGIPVPIFVGSGNGVHPYWPLDIELTLDAWYAYASGLKTLCGIHGLQADPYRTSDAATIMRPPGSHHRKNGEREVQYGQRLCHYPLSAFAPLQSAAAPVEPRRATLSAGQRAVSGRRATADNILTYTAYEATYGEAIAAKCHQLGTFRQSGNVPEPFWYACLGVLSRCEDGRALAHEWSARDFKDYSAQETDYKLDRTLSLSGATTCAKLEQENPGGCNGCIFKGKIGSPISLGSDPVETPVPGVVEGELIEVDGLPPLPSPYMWSEARQLVCFKEGKNGTTYDLISQHPIYLDTVQTGEIDRSLHSYRFCKFAPYDGWREVVVDASLLHGAAGIATMFGKGVVIHDPSLFLSYVRCAVDAFHTVTALETRYDQFGWKNEDTAFLFGNMLYTAAGPVEAVAGKEATIRAQSLGPRPRANLHAWTEAADGLFASQMEGVSAAVLASFAAPLMKWQAANEGGAVLHLYTPESGQGKTTSLMGAWTVWGQKEALNLTNDDTRVSKPIAMGTLGNLPVIYDELRNKDPEMIRQFVVMFTEGRDRMRGTVDGTIRHTKATWQTVLLSAANNSLLDQLTTEGTDAPAYRVLELGVSLPADLDKTKGDRLKKVLSEHAGTAGDAYLRYLMLPEVRTWAQAALSQWTDDIWKATRLGQEHRFRVRLIGAIAVAGAIVNKLDILHFQTERIVQWLIGEICSRRQQTSITSVPTRDRAIGVFGEFINEHFGEVLVVPDRWKARAAKMTPIVEPRNKLSIRYEIATKALYIAENIFREWCVKRQMSPRTVIQMLKDEGVVVDNRKQLTLSAGTTIPGAQIMCIQANANHPAMSDFIETLENTAQANSEPPF